MPKAHRRTERLKERVAHWAIRLKVKPRLVRIQRMTRKWGSCSTAGTITLAADLNDQEAGFQDFVIAHEQLHLRLPNHGRLIKALMTAHVPNWRTFDVIRRTAWLRSTGNPPHRGGSTQSEESIGQGGRKLFWNLNRPNRASEVLPKQEKARHKFSARN